MVTPSVAARRLLLAPTAALALLFCFGGNGAYALPAVTTFTADAQVVAVDPIVRRERITEPVEQCTRVRERHPASRGPHYRHHIAPPHEVLRSVIGGLVGGAIGSKFGGGRGQKAMTVLGAMAGAAVARGRPTPEAPHRYERHDRGYREICEQTLRVREVETVSAYRVRYRYQGELGTRILEEPPGETIPVTVRLRPVARPR